jgi:DNA-binding response OmpR family regulator
MMSRGGNAQSIAEYSFKNMGLPAAGNEPLRSENLKVLLVEDDDADVYLIKKALTENPRVGEIVLAQDAVEALELIDSGAVKPDLAIVDLHMPRKDGFALLLELGARQSVSFPSIVLTSSRSGADALRSRNRGADMYLVKPSTLGKLTALMDDVIATM